MEICDVANNMWKFVYIQKKIVKSDSDILNYLYKCKIYCIIFILKIIIISNKYSRKRMTHLKRKLTTDDASLNIVFMNHKKVIKLS